VQYLSSGDSTLHPALFYAPDVSKTCPVLVALHTWSSDYLQTSSVPYLLWCIEKDWAFIHPNFREANNKPEATGSELVVADIVSAADYAISNANADLGRIYLVGVSGGGHATLLMAGRVPDIWAGVSAWVPITDLAAWYFESKDRGASYANHIVMSTGGIPGASAEVDFQYKARSPITHLANATAPLDINAGINDGHTGSVPISHSLNAFNSTLAFQAAVASRSSIASHFWTGNRTYPVSCVDLTYLLAQIYRLTKARTSEKVTSCF
jgi:dipeptidyl aminopeptidase/acylaminoacyl peptidase